MPLPPRSCGLMPRIRSTFTCRRPTAMAVVVIARGSWKSSGCDMLFANHNIAFRDIYVDTVAGSAVSPDFYENDTDQECSMNSTFNSTGGNIYWNS